MPELLPDVQAPMLSAEFWTDEEPVSPDQEELRNRMQQGIFSASASLLPLLQLNSRSAALASQPELFHQLHDMELPVQPPLLYDSSGQRLTAAFWENILSLVRSAQTYLLSHGDLRPGFTVCRARVRRWPTIAPGFRTPGDCEFDRFQDTALHTFEPVLILSQTQNGQWYYIRSTTYQGWVLQSEVALCSWDEFHDWSTRNDLLIPTANSVFTQAAPHHPAAAKKWLEFAAYLPVCEDHASPLGNQSPVGNIAIYVPSLSDQGTLAVHRAFVSKNTPTHRGYLPYTRHSVVVSAFSLLTERYGWGDNFGTHDCSSFVMDVYRTAGLQLPRDTHEQERALWHRFEMEHTLTYEERGQLLMQLGAGDLLYMPGHVMMYLGRAAGRHYVIHDFSGYTTSDAGNLRENPVNQVMVSTLDMLTASGRTFLESLTSAASLFKL